MAEPASARVRVAVVDAESGRSRGDLRQHIQLIESWDLGRLVHDREVPPIPAERLRIHPTPDGLDAEVLLDSPRAVEATLDWRAVEDRFASVPLLLEPGGSYDATIRLCSLDELMEVDRSAELRGAMKRLGTYGCLRGRILRPPEDPDSGIVPIAFIHVTDRTPEAVRYGHAHPRYQLALPGPGTEGAPAPFCVIPVPPGDKILAIADPGCEAHRVEVRVEAGQEVDLGEISLRAGTGKLDFVVEDERGRPVPGARAGFTGRDPFQQDPQSFGMLIASGVQADAKGIVRVDSLPTQLEQVLVDVRSDDHAGQAVVLKVGSRGTRIRLARPGRTSSLEARVVDQGGRAIAGASVHVANAGGGPGFETGADGRAEITGIDPSWRTVYLFVHAKRCCSAYPAVKGDLKSVEIRLDRYLG